MRPQQNRRMRGRSNNNGNRNRMPNPLTRNYESNGPDVKIRGNAQHIADKYTTLARDAQASGDRVKAENYLQHAEHYVRIILSAQPQVVQIPRDDTSSYDEQGGSNVVDLPVTNMSDIQEETHGEDLPLTVEQGVHDMGVDGKENDMAASGNEMEAVSAPERPQADRPRRITRRRLPRQIVAETENAQPATHDADDESKKVRRPKSVKPVVSVIQGEVEPSAAVEASLVTTGEIVEKPRRRRRVLKNDDMIVEAS